MHVRSIVAALLLLAAPHVESQEPTSFGETLEVRIINVDVVVRDKAGNLVGGLTAEDFVIREDGKAQPISNFAEYRQSVEPVVTPESDAPPVVAKPPESRNIVFFFDHLDLRETANRLEFFAGLRDFAEKSMRANDKAMVYFFNTSLEKLLPMTSDRAALLAVIDKMGEDSKLRLTVADTEASELAMRRRVLGADPALANARGWDLDAAASPELNGRWAAQRAYDRQARKVYAINTVITSLAGLEGRKILVLAADELSKFPGREFGYEAREFNARSMMDDIVDSANAAAVTIYSYHPKGIPMDPMGASAAQYESQMNTTYVLDSISTRTGGTFASGGRLSAADLAGAVRQLDNYYSLAYRAPAGRAARSRAIRVDVLRPGLEVLVRSSVVEKTADEVARDRMISSVLFGIAPSTIPISLKQGPLTRRGLTTMKVPIEITIPIASLTAVPGAKGYEGLFRVLAIGASGEGDVSEIAEKKQPFHIPAKDLEKSRSKTFTYTLEIIVRDTSDRALVAVIDDLDKDVGYAEVVLDMTKVAKAQPVTGTKPKWQPIATPSGTTRP